MELRWTSEGEESHSAESSLGAVGTAHLVVESLGEAGWDWHVCEVAHRLRPHYGLADTLEEATERRSELFGLWPRSSAVRHRLPFQLECWLPGSATLSVTGML